MSEFLSFMAGGFVGMAIMCLLAISKDSSDDAETWNRVQAALLAEKELAELKAAVMWEMECEELNSIITEKYACMSESAPEEDEISVSHFRAIAAVDELCGGGE